MRRPKLLITAARHYAASAEGRVKPRPESTILADEAELEGRRREGDPRYRVSRHVEVLGEYLLATSDRADAAGET